jgi:hypothetical protein
MRKLTNKIELLFPLFLYFLTIYGLVIISKNPTIGYEPSIYESSFKELIILVMSSIGTFIYLYFIDKKRKYLIAIALILVIINNFIILSLPTLRGYIIQGDIDALTHLGNMKDIIIFGNSRNIIYPISHILIVSMSLLINISIIQVTAYINPIFSILYVSYIYLLSKKIFDDIEKTILIALSSATFLFLGFEAELKPQFLSLITIPIFLYFLFSKQSFGTRIILLLIIVLVQFFHPNTSLYFDIGIFLTILYMFIKRQDNIMVSYNDYKNLLSIGMVSFTQWIYNFKIWSQEIIGLFKMINGKVSSPAGDIQSSFAKLKLTRLEIAEVFIRMYGHILIFVIISFIFIAYYFKFMKKEPKNDLINILIILFVSGLIIEILIIGGGIPLVFFRGLNYVIVIAPIFVGSFLYQVKKRYHMKQIMIRIMIGIVILAIISSSWLIGTFGIFSSPYIEKPTDQISKTDMFGADWFFKYKNPNVDYIGGHIYIRFSHLILGVNETNRRSNRAYSRMEYNLPDHFNYDKLNILGKNFTRNTYMTIAIYDRLLYTEGPWKPVGRFVTKDFDNLNYDISVNNIYDNEAMDVYYIKGSKDKVHL